MFIYLFFRFLFHPELLLTEVRSAYGRPLAFLAAASALATATLANYLMFRSSGSVPQWIVGSVITLLSVILAAIVYFPLIHLFAEKYLSGSRVSDLLAYGAFGLAPLFVTLPLALIFLLVPKGQGLYLAALIVIFVKILINLIKGVKENYQLASARKAVWLFFAPFFVVSGLVLANGLLSMLLFSHG